MWMKFSIKWDDYYKQAQKQQTVADTSLLSEMPAVREGREIVGLWQSKIYRYFFGPPDRNRCMIQGRWNNRWGIKITGGGTGSYYRIYS